MKRDMDLIRDILIEVEEKSPYNNMFEDPHSEESLKLSYHYKVLIDAGFVNMKLINADNATLGAFISGLTWEGHNFLDNIRSDTVWKKVKEKLAKVGGTVSIDVLVKLATNVASELLKVNL